MALVDVQELWLSNPRNWTSNAGAPRIVTHLTLTASGHRCGVVFRAPATGNIKYVVFRTVTVATSGTVEARIETVSATTGLPTGTLATAGATGTQVGLAANTSYAITLGTAHSATKNELLSVHLVSTTAINAAISGLDRGPLQTYSTYMVSGSPAWAKLLTTVAPNIAIAYDDGAGGMQFYDVEGMWNVNVIQTMNYANNSTAPTPRGMGNRSKRNYKVRCAGIWAYLTAIGSDIDLALYDDDTTPTLLRSVSLDRDQLQVSGNGGYVHQLFASPITINANDWVRALVVPTGATVVNLAYWDVPSAEYMGLYPGGLNNIATQFTTGPTWSNIDTRRAMVGLIVDQIDDGTGGGGGGNTYSRGRVVNA